MLNADRIEEAERYLDRASAIGTASADLQFQLGVLRYKQERLADAEAHLLEMVELEPTDHRGHKLLARIYREMGRGRDSLRSSQRAYQLNPDPDKQGRRARLKRKVRRFEEVAE
jgi:tetratricopeptide (TPR) repeat protein